MLAINHFCLFLRFPATGKIFILKYLEMYNESLSCHKKNFLYCITIHMYELIRYYTIPNYS